MDKRLILLASLAGISSCSSINFQTKNKDTRTPSSAKTCISNICIGDKVYSYSLYYKNSMEVVAFQERFIGGNTKPTGKAEIDFLAVLNDPNSHDSYRPTEDIREIYLDAGADACMEFTNNPNIKACVGDEVAVIPLWNYQFPEETKKKIENYQKETGQRFTYAKIIKVLKMNERKDWGKDDRAIVQTKIPGVGTILVSSSEIGFTKENMCAYGSSNICIGDKFTSFFNEQFSILAYLPAGDNGSSNTQIVITTPLKGLKGKDDFRVNDGFNQLIDPNYKSQSRVYKERAFIQIALSDSEKEAMKKMDKMVNRMAQEECTYRIWGRGVIDNSIPITPEYSNCKFSVDNNIYVGHGVAIGKGIPRRYLECDFKVDLTCNDKDLK